MKAKSKLKPKTIKLLRQIKRKILAEPRQFVMGGYFKQHVRWKIPNCGTAACIAGHALALRIKANPAKARDVFTGWEQSTVAAKYLGLDTQQADNLFHVSHWPRRFKKDAWEDSSDFDSSGTAISNAKRAARRIEHFIKTGK